MLYRLIVLLAIHFDYQIKVGQIEICKKILTLAKHIFVGQLVLCIKLNLIVFKPCANKSLSFTATAQRTSSATS